ncbi:unnamed protein product [Calypogeia fissa]
MADKEKKKESKKAKGEGEEKDGKSTKEGKDPKFKKDKDNTESSKKGGGAKEGDKKGATTKEADKKAGVATLTVDPNAPPPLDAEGNPICVQPDPKPTFEELWFDDPVEGEYAQKMALELKGRIEVKALSIRQYLEGAIVPVLLEGLEHMVLERPTNPAEYLAAFLLRNNPLKDMEYVEPPEISTTQGTPPVVEVPKCCGCKVHCPATPTHHDDVPDFFRKGDKQGTAEVPRKDVPKKDEKVAPTPIPAQAPKKAT